MLVVYFNLNKKFNKVFFCSFKDQGVIFFMKNFEIL